MTDPTALRRAFSAFLGEERYRKFFRQGLKRGKLRFWQELEWKNFTEAHPEFSIDFEELVKVLRYCVLHEEELQPDTVGVFRGCRDFTREYELALVERFPYASNDEWSTEGMPFEGGRVDVWFCPACRSAKAAWLAKRTRQK